MAKRPTYRELEHTADVGIELDAPDLPSAFELAAASMFDMISDLDGVREEWRREVRVSGRQGDLQNLMIRWLAELLYVHESERVLLSSFDITLLQGNVIEAAVAGEKIDLARHGVKLEIKAPTYHDLRVEEAGGAFHVRVIFDT